MVNEVAMEGILKIKKIRKQKRITLVELAEKLGYSQAYMARLERGVVPAIPEQVELIKSVIDEWPEDETLYHRYNNPFQL